MPIYKEFQNENKKGSNALKKLWLKNSPNLERRKKIFSNRKHKGIPRKMISNRLTTRQIKKKKSKVLYSKEK